MSRAPLRTGLGAAALLLLGTQGSAQVGAALRECPDSLFRSDAPRVARVSIDTTYTLSIARKQWSARALEGSVAIGAAGTERASPAACAGAWIRADRAQVLLENVRGTVRIRASVEPLLEVIRRHPSRTR